MVITDPVPGQEAWFLPGAGKLEWLLFSTVRKKHVPRTRWLAAQSFPFSLPEVPVVLPERKQEANWPRITSLVRLSKWAPAHCGRARGKIKPGVETGTRATCHRNVQGGHHAGLLLGLDGSQNSEAPRSGC